MVAGASYPQKWFLVVEAIAAFPRENARIGARMRQDGGQLMEIPQNRQP
jgi:hypothetical protein